MHEKVAQKWHVPSSPLREKRRVKMGNSEKNGLNNCIRSPSNQRKTHVLDMPGDDSCEIPNFETKQFGNLWKSHFLRGENNKNKISEIVISSCKQNSCHIYDTTIRSGLTNEQLQQCVRLAITPFGKRHKMPLLSLSSTSH